MSPVLKPFNSPKFSLKNIKPELFVTLNANVRQVIISICPLKNANWTQTDSRQQHAFHVRLEPVPVMFAVHGHTLIPTAIPLVDLENNLELIALHSLLLTRMLLISVLLTLHHVIVRCHVPGMPVSVSHLRQT